MTTFERRQQLIDILRRQPGLRVPELARLLSVSQGTIRNDLNALDDAGSVMRVHGGAAVSDPLTRLGPGFFTRARSHDVAKEAIARAAAALVQDGDSILVDASTTVLHLALALQDHQQLRVVTNGVETARALARNPTNSVLLLGGALNTEGSAISGPLSEQFLEGLHIQTAFVSCSGFSLEAGLTEVHLSEAQLKIKMVKAASRLVALVDSSKFGKLDLTAFASIAQVSHLYTDQQLSADWATRLQQAGVPFTICAETNPSPSHILEQL